MKILFISTCTILVLSVCFLNCGQPSNSQSNVAQLLLDLEKEAIQKEFRNDTTFLSSIMDSTFIELSNGKIKNKHDVLKTIFQNNIYRMQDSIVQDSFILEEPVVHLYDGAAVVSFIMHTYNKKANIPFERRTRFYDVWVKRGREWKAVTWQATPVNND